MGSKREISRMILKFFWPKLLHEVESLTILHGVDGVITGLHPSIQGWMESLTEAEKTKEGEGFMLKVKNS